jgi:hypothetical protein
MVELKNIVIKGFEDENVDAIPYKDKRREEQRLEKLKDRKAMQSEYIMFSFSILSCRVGNSV